MDAVIEPISRVRSIQRDERQNWRERVNRRNDEKNAVFERSLSAADCACVCAVVSELLERCRRLARALRWRTMRRGGCAA